MNGHTFKPLFTWRTAICDSDLTPTERHVALTLSLHMNERGGSCWPTIPTLAAETGLNRATVIKATSALEAKGWLRVAHTRGRGHSNEYEAAVPNDLNGRPVPPFSGSETSPSATISEAKTSSSAHKRSRRTTPVLQEGVTEKTSSSPPTTPSPAVAEPSSSTTGDKPLARQLWDVFDELFGPVEGLERGRRNAAIKSLISSGATPDTLRVAANTYRTRFSAEVLMTPTALAANWSTLAAEARPHVTGWRYTRGSHGATYVEDPEGTDRPPSSYTNGAP